MTTFVCHPERGGPYPAIILYMDAYGIREELRDMVRRLACVGYYVMLPNLYYRSGMLEVGAGAVIPAADGVPPVAPLVYSLNVPLVMSDTDALIAFIDEDAAAKAGKIGTVGYCMSARYAMSLAARFPDRVAAAASIYGTWLFDDTPDSLHLAAARASAKLYFACAEIDHWVPVEEVGRLRTFLAEAGAKAEVELYAGYEHGFAFPQRASYSRDAAERHWERLFALFRDSLDR